MRQRVVQVLLVLSLGVGAAGRVAQAQATASEEPPDRVEQILGRYRVQPAFEKLGRGASNALFGWLEIPLTIHHRYAPQDAGTSLLGGFAYGLLRGLIRTGVGLYETATFFLPYPAHFAPILPTLDYFEQEKREHEHLPLE